ncbi:MAG: hypothetical protein HKN74_02185 [Acidimicrobiia bacterium]|nr:ATP-binding protein [Acidimicrobiia bacterium]MBT8216969.1 ATP-binding protein [Acidimicrobiia bacterium]NNF09070.1 hypothetical protein [Acidimicrobiia bacterium]NNL71284.1 hypothetical protein [Acidimicrobiia bacterium]
MTSPGPAGTFRLEVPADPEYLSQLRVFAAAVARRLGVADDGWLDDLKLLISEAATYALGITTERLTLEIAPTATGFDFTLSPVPAFGQSGSVPDPYDVITSLADIASHGDDRLVLALTRP